MRVVDLVSNFGLTVVLNVVGQILELIIGHHLHAKSMSAVGLLFLGPLPGSPVESNPVVIKAFFEYFQALSDSEMF